MGAKASCLTEICDLDRYWNAELELRCRPVSGTDCDFPRNIGGERARVGTRWSYHSCLSPQRRRDPG